MYLRGTGDFDRCRETLQPFMNKTNETQTSLNGVYQPPIQFQNSEFYGFSEFYYCTEDVLRMGGDYNAAAFTKAAKVTLRETPRCASERLAWTVAVMACPRFWRLQSRRRGRWRVEVPVQHAGSPVPVAGQEKESRRKQKAAVSWCLPTIP